MSSWYRLRVLHPSHYLEAIECGTRETCSPFGLCELGYKVPDAGAVDVDQVTKVVSTSVGVLVALLVVLAAAFLAYKKCKLIICCDSLV